MAEQQIAALLASCVGDEFVSGAKMDRTAYSGDLWPRIQIWKQSASFGRTPPDCVVWPGNSSEVSEVVSLCQETETPIVAYGAGSGVCGGTVPVRGGVVVDVRRMDQILSIDEEAMTVDAQAGVLGHHLEQALQERGYTLGHFPSSILCSSLGGWLATRSAGQFSSRYGKIEDMVLGLEVVLASGTVLRTGAYGKDGELDWTQVFVGSEGTLGVLTRSLLRIQPLPPEREYRGCKFPSLDSALKGMRSVMQSGIRPTVLRLYDPLDTLVGGKDGKATGEGGLTERVAALIRHATEKGEPLEEEESDTLVKKLQGGLRQRLSPWVSSFRSKAVHAVLGNPRAMNRLVSLVTGECLLVFGTEGSPDEVESDMAQMRAIFEESGGEDVGEEPGKEWLKHRYSVSFKQSKIYANGAFADTIEVASPWSRVLEMYDEVRRSVSQYAIIMAHFSHAYRDGCSIYFTFAGACDTPAEAERVYARVWHDALNAVVRSGGTISHHHGVGLLKRDFMAREHGQGDRVFFALKAHFDPKGIMNPGKLFPDPDDENGEVGRGVEA